MINPGHPRLSIVRQCELASISRSSFYRQPTAENERDALVDASHRRAVPREALVRLAADGAASAPQRCQRHFESDPGLSISAL